MLILASSKPNFQRYSTLASIPYKICFAIKIIFCANVLTTLLSKIFDFMRKFCSFSNKPEANSISSCIQSEILLILRRIYNFNQSGNFFSVHLGLQVWPRRALGFQLANLCRISSSMWIPDIFRRNMCRISTNMWLNGIYLLTIHILLEILLT